MCAKWTHSGDLDVDALADDFERLAEAIRDDEVGNLMFKSTDTNSVGDHTTRTIELKFQHHHKHTDLLTAKYKEADR